MNQASSEKKHARSDRPDAPQGTDGHARKNENFDGNDPDRDNAGKGRRTNNANARDGDILVIKKYPNRRLYNSAKSRYITLDDLAVLVRSGITVKVVDAKNGADLTRATLAQIIFDNEGKQTSLLPTEFLRQLIYYYDKNIRSLLPDYLQGAITKFTAHQDDMRQMMLKNGNFFLSEDFPKSLDDLGRKQSQMMRDSMRLFLPGGLSTQEGQRNDENVADDKESDETDNRRIRELEAEVAALRKKIATKPS